MTESLKQLKVLVTRPASQATELCRRIVDKGGKVISLPLLEIGPPDIPLNNVMNRLSGADIAIFISKNAVIWSMDHFGIRTEVLQRIQTIAIGQSTAECLKQRGLNNVIFPDKGSDSELLLTLDALQQESVDNKKIIIFRGHGGRETLAEELRARGAEVTYLEIYKRNKPVYDQDHIDYIVNDFDPDVIIITSNETLKNLFEIINPQQKKLISKKIFLVMSQRIADLGKKYNINSIVITGKASDEGIIDSLELLKLSGNK